MSKTPLLDTIKVPEDLRRLPESDLRQLADELRIETIEAGRQRTRRLRYLSYAVILIAVAWSIEVIVVKDTDWSRITLASLLESARRFFELDVSVVPELWKPALEKVVMATLATVVGLVMPIPVAWLGASNITPFGKTSYAVGRFLMTMSRSVHEIVWGLIFVSAVGLGALAAIFIIIRIISIPDSVLPADGRGIGIWISLVAALGVIAGGLLRAAEEL